MFRSANKLGWLLGDEPNLALRERIAHFLARHRAVQVSPEDIVVASGLEQGLFAFMRLIADPGRAVFLDPSLSERFRGTLLAAGVRLRDELPSKRPICVRKGAYGGRRDFQRSLRTLSLIERMEGIFVEVDTGELCSISRSLKSVAEGHVACLGLLPEAPGQNSQIAYLLPTPGLSDLLRKMLFFCGRPPPMLLQHTMAEFMRRGFYERYLARRSREVG